MTFKTPIVPTAIFFVIKTNARVRQRLKTSIQKLHYCIKKGGEELVEMCASLCKTILLSNAHTV